MPDHAPTQPKRPRPGRRSAASRGQPNRVTDFPVVGIGASAGGLEACKTLLEALPPRTGMAFILVQHLDPTHESLMVELLAEHTAMPVLQVTDGMLVEPDHLYVIPPGSYLSAAGGTLHLSPSQVRDGTPRGARLPFDVLLNSLSVEYGGRAVCVVLSGTGTDGSLGLAAVKAAGGLTVVQDPEEAGYDGMPRSAIGTGKVDTVARAAAIPAMLAAALAGHGPAQAALAPAVADPLSGIIALVRARTKHDFAPYKRGTLERRVERRMSIALPGGQTGGEDSAGRERISRYLDLLRTDAGELGLLAKDLLIHVTGFFRDPAAYAALADTVVSHLVRDHPQGGSPDAARARKPIPSSSCSARRSPPPGATSSCRSSRPTSTPRRSPRRGKVCIPWPPRRTCLRRASPGSSARRMGRATGCCRTCGQRWCSPCRTC